MFPAHVFGASSLQQPIQIPTSGTFLNYQELTGIGDVAYYSLHVTVPETITVHISIPNNAAERFAPQFVVFSPNTLTIGPILPIIQPQNTIAAVYPITPVQPLFNSLTQTDYTSRLVAQPRLQSVGEYTLAVYNAGTSGGKYRLTIDRGNSATQLTWDIWNMPLQWWHDQLFAGFGWYTLMTPVLLFLFGWLVYLRLDHHQLHAHKKYPPKPSTIKPKKS